MKRNIQALVIGNGAYSGRLRLECPKNDAQAVAETLRNLGVDVHNLFWRGRYVRST